MQTQNWNFISSHFQSQYPFDIGKSMEMLFWWWNHHEKQLSTSFHGKGSRQSQYVEGQVKGAQEEASYSLGGY